MLELFSSILATAAAKTITSPNFVLALADDLGFSDVGWKNSNLHTPHLNSLQRKGVTLHRHYVFCYCSPTRGSLLTGRLPHHDHQLVDTGTTHLSYGDVYLTCI